MPRTTMSVECQVGVTESAKGIQGKERWGKEVFLEEVMLDLNLEN